MVLQSFMQSQPSLEESLHRRWSRSVFYLVLVNRCFDPLFREACPSTGNWNHKYIVSIFNSIMSLSEGLKPKTSSIHWELHLSHLFIICSSSLGSSSHWMGLSSSTALTTSRSCCYFELSAHKIRASFQPWRLLHLQVDWELILVQLKTGSLLEKSCILLSKRNMSGFYNAANLFQPRQRKHDLDLEAGLPRPIFLVSLSSWTCRHLPPLWSCRIFIQELWKNVILIPKTLVLENFTKYRFDHLLWFGCNEAHEEILK